MLWEISLVLLLGLSALVSTSAVSACLDPTSTGYKCELDSSGSLDLRDCETDLQDEDLDDLATCLDDFGRENVVILSLQANNFTTLPEGLFEGLTAVNQLYLNYNALTTLPAGLFEGLTALTLLWLQGNALTTLPEGVFEGLTAVEYLLLHENALTTLPAGLFEGLPSLITLRLDGNSMECFPTTSLVEVDFGDQGVWIDSYGDECGCSITGVTDNLCGDAACTPGEFGYTCGGTLAPVSAPTSAPVSATPAPESAPEPTTAPNASSGGGTLAPVAAPAPTTMQGTTAVSSSEAPVVAIVAGSVGGAFLVGGLVFFALFKTGRIKIVKRDRSSSPAAAASGTASYPTVHENPSATQYPVRPNYPERIS